MGDQSLCKCPPWGTVGKQGMEGTETLAVCGETCVPCSWRGGWPTPRPLGQLSPTVSRTPVAKRVPCKPKRKILLRQVPCLASKPCPQHSPGSEPSFGHQRQVGAAQPPAGGRVKQGRSPPGQGEEGDRTAEAGGARPAQTLSPVLGPCRGDHEGVLQREERGGRRLASGLGDSGHVQQGQPLGQGSPRPRMGSSEPSWDPLGSAHAAGPGWSAAPWWTPMQDRTPRPPGPNRWPPESQSRHRKQPNCIC